MAVAKRKPGWWVVTDIGPMNEEGRQRVGRCTRCGDVQILKVNGMNLKALPMHMKAFVQEHIYCKEVADAAEKG